MQLLALFDLDDTLIDRSQGFRVCVRAFVADLSLGVDAEEWLLAAMAQRAYRRDFEGFRSRFELNLLSDVLWARYCSHMADAVSCPDGVLTGLDDLRRAGWRTAVVTNGASDIQRAKLRRTGIDRLVDAVCISEEAGVRKPDAAIFERAADLCGMDLHGGGWMVGDNANTDIAGAQAAGLRTVWICGLPSTENTSDVVVPSVLEAIDFLKSLPSQVIT